jgi:hypothetical protein
MKLNEMADNVDMAVRELTVSIDNIYPPKAGQGNEGSRWQMQSLLVSDDTGQARLTLRNRAEISQAYKGNAVTFKSVKNEKHGLLGVKVVMSRAYTDTYGKSHPPVPEIRVTGSAEMLLGSSETIPQSKPSAEAPSASHRVSEGDSMKSVKVKLMKRANLYDLCLGAAKFVAGKHGLSAESDIKDIASCFFIQGVRDGEDQAMPAHPLSIEKKEPMDDNIPY